MSNWSPPSKCGLLAVAVAFLLASLPFHVSAEEYRSPSDGIQSMKYEDGRLSLEAKDASLDKVLSELSRMAMLTIIADGPIEGRITLYADRVPLEKALRKILRGKDTSFVYASKAETTPAEYDITEVRIYLAKSDKGEARRYSYSQRSEERDSASSPSRSPRERPRGRGFSPRPPSGSPRMPPSGSPPMPPTAPTEEAQELMSALMKGDLDGLDEIVEKLKDQNPQVEEQIDAFVATIQDARNRAEESGLPIPPLEGLGNIQELMKQMHDNGRMSRGQGPE